MAMAVQQLFPNARVTIGPWTETGFYYDFDNPAPFTEADLKAIKKAECCNGTVVKDEDMGEVLQLQGDQRDAVSTFLTNNGEYQAPPLAQPPGGLRERLEAC